MWTIAIIHHDDNVDNDDAGDCADAEHEVPAAEGQPEQDCDGPGQLEQHGAGQQEAADQVRGQLPGC